MARAGQYREQIQLIFPDSSVSDGIGGYLATGEGQKVPVWARIQQLKGAQLLDLGKEITTQVFKISIRYRADATNADQILWKSQYMKIQSQVADEKRTEITIYAIGGN